MRHPDFAACRRLLREGSQSFFAASLLLPRRVRDPASAVYAFCRIGDHAIDLTDDPAAALGRLEGRLDRCYSGRPDGAVERAFASVAAASDIPRTVPDALLKGFRWDVESRRYEDLPALCAYCVRVGATVGVMMSLVMGRRRPEVLRGACELGIAMQLTNVARDVGEDAARGRLYLPLVWMREAGIDPDAWLRSPRFEPRLGGVVARLLDAADALYLRSWPAISTLPASCRPGIRAASLIYSHIGDQIRQAGCDSVSRRACTTRRRKAELLVRAIRGVPPRPKASEEARLDFAPPGPEALADAAAAASSFLVESVTGTG